MPTLTVGASTSRPAFWRTCDLAIPAAAVYAGLRYSEAPASAQVWGAAIVVFAIVLLAARLRWRESARPVAAAQIALAVLLCAPVALDIGDLRRTMPAWHLIAIWLLSVGAAVAVFLRQPPQALAVGLSPVRSLDRTDAVLTGLLLGTALVLHVPGLDSVPLGMDVDEGSLGQSARDAAWGRIGDPFSTGWVSHPTLQFFANGVFVAWLGPTIAAARLPAAFMSSLAVALLYVLGRVGYGRTVGLIAGILALGSDVLLHFGRLGLNNVSDALFVTGTLAALWWGAATGRPAAFVLAGIGLGLSQYFYFGSRALPVIVVTTVGVWLLADHRGCWRARRLLLTVAATALIVAAPLLGYWQRHPDTVSDALRRTGGLTNVVFARQAERDQITIAEVWTRRALDSALVFTRTPDRGSFYHAGEPMLHRLMAPVFWLGLLVVVWGLRRPFNQGVLAWIATVLIPGSLLMDEVATFQRLLGALPGALLVAAVGIRAVADALQRHANWSVRQVTVAGLVLAAGLSLASAHFYFAVYTPRQDYKPPEPLALSLIAADYAAHRGDGTFLVYSNDDIRREEAGGDGRVYQAVLRYVADDRIRTGLPRIEAQVDHGRPIYCYFLPERAADIARVVQVFPDGSLSEYRRSDGLLLLTRYAVTPHGG